MLHCQLCFSGFERFIFMTIMFTAENLPGSIFINIILIGIGDLFCISFAAWAIDYFGKQFISSCNWD